MAKRIEWIDILKGIGILAVILGHCYSVVGYLPKYIYSFHMPLFFFVSGYLYHHEKTPFKAFLQKIMKTLLIPHYLFLIISICYYFTFVTQMSILDLTLRDLKIIAQTLFIPDREIFASFRVGGPLWFLPCLFTSQILFYFIMLMSRGSLKRLSLFLVISSIIGYVESISYLNAIPLPWMVDISLTTVVFLGAGYLVRKMQGANKDSSSSRLSSGSTIFIAPLLIMYIIFSQISAYPSVGVNKYGNYLYFYLAAFSGIAFYMRFAIMLDDTRVSLCLSFLGANSLIIYGLHAIVLDIGTRVLNMIILYYTSVRILVHPDLYGLSVFTATIIIFAPLLYLIRVRMRA